jgi:alkaline phosphatase D
VLTSLHAPIVRPPVSLPAFAREVGFEVLDAPFRDGIVAHSGSPGEAVISARLCLSRSRSTLSLVYWEVGCDAQHARPERHGLMRCAGARPELRVSLQGLEPGRVYWYRCWAGGHWSRVGHFYSASR